MGIDEKEVETSLNVLLKDAIRINENEVKTFSNSVWEKIIRIDEKELVLERVRRGYKN